MIVEEQVDLTARLRMWYIQGDDALIVAIMEDGDVRFFEEVKE